MEYNVISADAHIDLRWLPADLFVSNAPAKWKDMVPKLVDLDDGKHWFAEGRDLAQEEGFGRTLATTAPPKQGIDKRVDLLHKVGFYDGRDHPSNPQIRLKDQTMDGVDAEVIYGILGMGKILQNRDLLRIVYQIYNDWVADFCQYNPDRFVGLACIPNHDPQAAADEVRRSTAVGLRGGDFDVSSAVKPIWHRDWDPLWAAVAECSMPLSFHTTGVRVRMPSDSQMAQDYFYQLKATRVTLFQLGGSEYLASIIFSGALDRYPGMMFVLGECGASWILYVLMRMDQEYNDRLTHLDLSLKPSEYWHRQGYTTFETEPLLPEVVRMVGEENIMWGNDYPHEDGVWPNSQETIRADLGQLDGRLRRKLTCENTGRLYGFIK